jgi:GT2 family glycosyltransferase
MTAPPAISIVIVTWNSRDRVVELLHSLAANPPKRTYEVIVVDNASRDGTVEAVKVVAPEVIVVANRINRGLPAANNQGMLAARGDFIVISNPDVVYQAGAVDALIGLLERRPEAGFAFARLHHPDGTLQTCTGDLPTVREALTGKAARLHRPDGRPQGFWWHGWEHNEEVPIGHGGESCYATRRSTVAAIGLQDERFRLDWEGIEWVARGAELGWASWFCPAAQVVHVGGASIRQTPLRWIVWTHLGMYRYLKPRTPLVTRPLLAAIISVRAVAKLLKTLGGGRSYDDALDAGTQT